MVDGTQVWQKIPVGKLRLPHAFTSPTAIKKKTEEPDKSHIQKY